MLMISTIAKLRFFFTSGIQIFTDDGKYA